MMIDIASSGICGTDLSIYAGKIAVTHPLVMGHEMFGHVAASADATLVEGTRVVVDPVVSCGDCFWCSKGQENLCPNGALLGRDRDGGFAESIAIPESNVYEVPDTIADAAAPLLQVLTVCIHGQRTLGLFPGESTVVIGLGVSGLLHLQIAKARGASPLIGITRSAEKRAVAERLGANLTIDAADPRLAEVVLDATSGRGPDTVIECVGKVETLAQSIDLVRVGGRIVLFGTITAGSGALDFYSLYKKEITLTNPRAAKPEDFPAAIDLAASGTIELEPLVTHTFPLHAADEAIAKTGTPGTLKVTLDHKSDRA
jgi:2-desacetyl-2-hydroxyethyl bacteriochlorophyllide A dehydrogenase